MRHLGPFDGFAASLRARHRRRGGAVPALEATVHVVSHVHNTAWHLHLASTPVNVSTPMVSTMAVPRADHHARPGRTARAIEPVGSPPPHPATGTRRVRESLSLVHHTTTRGLRVEPGAAPVPMVSSAPRRVDLPPSLAGQSPIVTTPPRPPLVVVRAARPVAEPVSRSSAAPEPTRSTQRVDGAPPAADPPPSIDLERITDSVLGALDRRLIAHRERYGNAR